jgi:hypothetical protein
MGAWGAGYFDNDDAGDFVSDLRDAQDWSVVRAALAVVASFPADNYLELTEGSAAIAASAVLAQKTKNFPATDFPEDLEAIDALAPAPGDLAQIALRALARVRSAKSELAELWQEAGDSDWLATIDALESSLK